MAGACGKHKQHVHAAASCSAACLIAGHASRSVETGAILGKQVIEHAAVVTRAATGKHYLECKQQD